MCLSIAACTYRAAGRLCCCHCLDGRGAHPRDWLGLTCVCRGMKSTSSIQAMGTEGGGAGPCLNPEAQVHGVKNWCKTWIAKRQRLQAQIPASVALDGDNRNRTSNWPTLIAHCVGIYDEALPSTLRQSLSGSGPHACLGRVAKHFALCRPPAEQQHLTIICRGADSCQICHGSRGLFFAKLTLARHHRHAWKVGLVAGMQFPTSRVIAHVDLDAFYTQVEVRIQHHTYTYNIQVQLY